MYLFNNKCLSPAQLIRTKAYQGRGEQKEEGMVGVKGMNRSCLTTKELGCTGLFLHQACLDPIFI